MPAAMVFGRIYTTKAVKGLTLQFNLISKSFNMVEISRNERK